MEECYRRIYVFVDGCTESKLKLKNSATEQFVMI